MHHSNRNTPPVPNFYQPDVREGIRACFTADANEKAHGVKWDSKRQEVVTVDDEIFEYVEEMDSEDKEAQNNANKFIIDLAAIKKKVMLLRCSPNQRSVRNEIEMQTQMNQMIL